MLLIYSIEDGPRLQYITNILFGTILGIEYKIIIVPRDFEPGDDVNAFILYGTTAPGKISVPNEGLLFEDAITNHNVNFEDAEIPILQFNEQKSDGYSIDFDIFSAAFYLITQYEYYRSLSFDSHGRHNEKSSIFHKNGLHKKPVVNIYASHIWELLKSKYPNTQRKKYEFDYKITFDIDTPYLYQHKGLILSLGSAIKSIIKLNFQALIQQIRANFSEKDPYDVYDNILDKVKTDKLLFFFLINRKSPHDGRHTFKNKAYRNLIKKISDAGSEIGIHPSYTSFMDADLIRTEKSELEAITGKPMISSRMHFLKYRLPETFEYLGLAGIINDYSLCPIHDVGFKSFISRPYNWFNLERNEETKLILHPTMVMDRSLQKYMHLEPEQAILEIKKIIDLTFDYNGIFTILFHNNSLSETSEWKEWEMVFEKTMMYLSDKIATS